MFTFLARVAHRGRWPIFITAMVLTIAASVWGPGVFREVTTAGSFVVSGSDSERTAQQLSEHFPDTDYDVMALISSTNGSADQEGLRETVEGYTAALDSKGVAGLATPWTLPTSGSNTGAAPSENPLISADGTKAVVLMTMGGEDAQTRNDDFVELRDTVRAPDGYSVGYAGPTAIEEGIGSQTKQDVTMAEMISMPILVLLLIIIFGSLTSSLAPVLMGGAATVGAFAALRIIGDFTEVSIFSVTIASILALVLAVDYGLFIVSRYREELAAGAHGQQAIVNTLRTAGETVAVSGVLVLISLSSLLLFPQNFLKSMAYGGMSTVAVALVFALVVLPALLSILGPKINSLKVPGRLRTPATVDSSGFLHRLSHAVMRRPVAFIIFTLVFLAPLIAPSLQLRLGSVDHRVLPPSHSVAQTAETLTHDFPGVDMSPVKILATGAGTPDADYVSRLADVPGIAEATILGVDGDRVQYQAKLSDDWQSDSAVDAVEAVRALTPPAGTDVLVGGMTAEMVDQVDAIYDRAPLALGILVLAILVLLTVAFRSVVLPIKAILMNLLSVVAAFGVMVWIFQQGHLSDLLGFTATGTLDPSNLILVFALLFGLSMDYEVFMLSRVKEEYERTGDNRHSVAFGLQSTGRIITAAAALLLVVVGAFSFSGISFIKMIGIGMIVAITIDVIIIRGLLVPATMRLFGDANWWPGSRGARTRAGRLDNGGADNASDAGGTDAKGDRSTGDHSDEPVLTGSPSATSGGRR